MPINNAEKRKSALVKANAFAKNGELFSFDTTLSKNFSQIETIANGSFGHVMKAINTDDSLVYAVKQIIFSVADDQLDATVERLSREARFLKLLSADDHPNIVRYMTCWLEPLEVGSGGYVVSCPSPRRVSSNLLVSPRRRPGMNRDLRKRIVGISRRLRASRIRIGIRRSFDSSTLTTSKVFDSNDNNHDLSPLLIQSPVTLCFDKMFTENISGDSPSQRKTPSTVDGTNEDFEIVFLDPAAEEHGVEADRRTVCERQPNSAIDVVHDETAMDVYRLQKSIRIQKRRQAHRPQLKPQISHHSMCIQMEYCPWTLECYLTRTEFPEYNRNDSLLGMIISGIHHCHKNGIMHRDMKPSNILFDPNGTLKIGDLGVACSICNVVGNDEALNYASLRNIETILESDDRCNRTSKVGTTIYAAPEQIEGKQYTSQVDMWSIGLIAIDLYSRSKTVMGRTAILQQARIGILPASMESQPPEVASFIKSLLNNDPMLRPTAAVLYERLTRTGSVFEQGLSDFRCHGGVLEPSSAKRVGLWTIPSLAENFTDETKPSVNKGQPANLSSKAGESSELSACPDTRLTSLCCSVLKSSGSTNYINDSAKSELSPGTRETPSYSVEAFELSGSRSRMYSMKKSNSVALGSKDQNSNDIVKRLWPHHVPCLLLGCGCE